MSGYQSVFERKEVKFLLSEERAERCFLKSGYYGMDLYDHSG